MKIYTVDEVAELLQVTPRTVYRYINDDNLEASKVGKYWRIQEKDIERFLDSKKNND